MVPDSSVISFEVEGRTEELICALDARKEIVPVDPREIIKDPMVLEFLGLKQEVTYYEKDLESAIIRHLQEFLLEMGNGFSFVQRQKRIHIDGDDFFIDLVFYNRLLQCFVIIEIKTNKIYIVKYNNNYIIGKFNKQWYFI